MTSKEVKVYLSKQITMCEEKIELYENVKASKDFIELHKNLLDFYKTIEKDLEILELIKERLHHNIFGNLQFVDKPTKKIDEDGNIVIIDDDKYKIMEWLDNEIHN